MDELITVRQAATLLGRHPDYLSLAIRRGILRGRHVGRDWVLTREAIDEYRALHMRSTRRDREREARAS